MSENSGDRLWLAKAEDGTTMMIPESKMRHVNPLLGGALGCACRGWFVHPLVPGGIKPLLDDWQNRATVDTDQVRAWWARWPYANVGVACGPSGLVAIRLDAKNGLEAWEDLKAQHGFSDEATPVCLIPDGGKLLIWVCDRAIPSSSDELGEGIDVIGNDGYFVTPPSVIHGGLTPLYG